MTTHNKDEVGLMGYRLNDNEQKTLDQARASEMQQRERADSEEESVKPDMDQHEAIRLIKERYGLTVTSIKEMDSYDDRNFKVKVAKEHTNPFVIAVHEAGYTLKVMNSVDSFREHVKAQNAVLKHLYSLGFEITVPCPMVDGGDMSVEEISSPGGETRKHMVRLLKFVPGNMLFELDMTPEILYRVGRCTSFMKALLRKFEHPALEGHTVVYALENVPALRDFYPVLQTDEQRDVMEKIITNFENHVLPNVGKFEKGTIHGDLHHGNIIFRKMNYDDPENANILNSIEGRQDMYQAKTVIDFGDMLTSYYVFDLGVTCMHLMTHTIGTNKSIHPLDAIGHILAGYMVMGTLNEHELRALKYTIAGRFAIILALGLYTCATRDNVNVDYVVKPYLSIIPVIHELLDTPHDQVLARWQKTIDATKTSKQTTAPSSPGK